jgi:Rne/Rng family ribonuclease
MKKEMLINVMQPEECRIAILENGVLEELYVERTSLESYVGNIYKGRIVNIEPSIQAAFVDFGVGRNGFLHVSDVEPEYYRHLEGRRPGNGGGGNGGRHGRGGRPQRGGGGRPYAEQNRGGRPPIPFDDDDFDLPPRGREVLRRPGMEPVPDMDDAPPPPPPPEGVERDRERPSGRGRGRGRRRDDGGRGRPNAPPPPPPPDVEPPDDFPRFMDSAERRTEEDAPNGPPVEPSTDVRDEDIFFPSEPEPTAHAVKADLPPMVVPEELPTWEEETPPEPELPHESVVGEFVDSEVIEMEFPPLVPKAPPQRHPRVERRPPPPPAPAPAPVQEAPEHEGDDLEAMEDLADDFEDEPGQRRGRGAPRGRPGGFRRGGRPGTGRPKPPIQEIFKRGQEVLVKVIKEGIGTKGPTLSTYISIPGRCLVLMPHLNRIGVSRKIPDDEERRRLREMLEDLTPPKGVGFIIRTAGQDKTLKEMQNDLGYLARLWQVVARRIQKVKSPAEVFQESDMITRTIRDIFTSDIDTIWVDEPAAFDQAQEFMQVVMPRYANRIKLYSDPEPMFFKYGIEEEIARIQQRKVPLPAGGSIVIDPTEALVAIDVNSGNFRAADNNAEETAYQMNLHAAKEIARQLRLRNLGGVIVNDFIDMREEKHRRGVEKALRDAMRRDRSRTKILKMSQFGLIEMTRQRVSTSLKKSVYQDCAHCRGTGQVKTTESMSIDVMRLIQLAANSERVAQVEIRVADEVAYHLLNRKRKEVAKLEEGRNIQVRISGLAGAGPEALEFLCYDNNNNEVKFLPAPEEPRRYRR